MTVRRDAAHRYWTAAGRELYGVTSILRDGGLVNEQAARFYTEGSRARGTDIHAALATYLATREEPLLSDEASWYWPPLLAFLEQSGFELESGEQVVADAALGYGGTYDLLGWLPAYARVSTEIDLIDVKTGAVPRTVGPQTMAYARPLRSRYGVIRRWALQLTRERYKLVPLNVLPSGRVDRLADRLDEQLFMAALCIANFRRAPELIGGDA